MCDWQLAKAQFFEALVRFTRALLTKEWWRRRELKSSVKENNFSRSCAVHHKRGVNKGSRAYLNFLSLDLHHAPKRTK
jgi:hypothetical protein